MQGQNALIAAGASHSEAELELESEYFLGLGARVGTGAVKSFPRSISFEQDRALTEII